jgi:hypothetical protein
VLTVGLGNVVDATDVGVRELPRDADLGEEALPADRIVGELTRQELERDRLSQLQVVGPIDLAHAATAEQTDDAIPFSQNRTRREEANRNRIGRHDPPDPHRRHDRTAGGGRLHL